MKPTYFNLGFAWVVLLFACCQKTESETSTKNYFEALPAYRESGQKLEKNDPFLTDENTYLNFSPLPYADAEGVPKAMVFFELSEAEKK